MKRRRDNKKGKLRYLPCRIDQWTAVAAILDAKAEQKVFWISIWRMGTWEVEFAYGVIRVALVNVQYVSLFSAS